jgi:hypothetical protein
MNKYYLEFIVSYYYLSLFLISKIIWNSKNKIMCYQSIRVNRIDSILLLRSYERSLGS